MNVFGGESYPNKRVEDLAWLRDSTLHKPPICQIRVELAPYKPL